MAYFKDHEEIREVLGGFLERYRSREVDTGNPIAVCHLPGA